MKLLFFFIPFILVLSLIGCTDDPNSTGIGLVPKQDGVFLKSFDTTARTASTFLKRVAGSTTEQLVGSTQGITARTMLQFSGLPYSQTGFILDTAVIRFAVNYKYKDSVGTIAFTVKRLLRSWVKDSLRWDSTEIPSLVNNLPDTSFEQVLAGSDTMLEIPVNPTVRNWMMDSLSTPNGLMLDPSVTSNMIVGCSSIYSSLYDGRPELRIVYRIGTDTTRFSLRAFQQAFYADGPAPPTSDSLFYVAGGISYRSQLGFDLTHIPKRASITKATLTLTLDTLLSSRNAYSTNTMVLHIALNQDSVTSVSSSSSLATDTSVTFSIDARALAQQLITHNSNYLFLITQSNELTGVDSYAFYSLNASDPKKRPHLSIIYSILP